MSCKMSKYVNFYRCKQTNTFSEFDTCLIYNLFLVLVVMRINNINVCFIKKKKKLTLDWEYKTQTNTFNEKDRNLLKINQPIIQDNFIQRVSNISNWIDSYY